MQDLTGTYKIGLAPSSMSGGNTISEDPRVAMTAPGSQSVNPVPDRYDIVPLPQLGQVIPVSNAPHKPRPAGGSDGGGGSFAHAALTGAWKGTPASG